MSPYLLNIAGDTLEGRIHGLAIDKNLPSQGFTIDTARQSVQKRSLGGTGRASNGQHFTRSCLSGDIVEQNSLPRHAFSLFHYNLAPKTPKRAKPFRAPFDSLAQENTHHGF